MTQTGTAQQNTLPEADSVRALFEKNKRELEMALPKHITADRMLRIVMTEVRKNPILLECDKRSLFGAVIQAAQLGLEPGSALGHAYLIPFWNGAKKIREVQFMPGYRGYIDLAGRSGRVSHIVARVVHKGDHFVWEYGTEEKLEHVPNEEDGELTHVYAIAFLKDGGKSFDVLTKKQIDKIRARSKAADSGPWVTDFEEMARKSAVRKLFKYLPVSIEIQRAVTLDDMAEAGISQADAEAIELPPEDFGPPAEKSGPSRVKVARSTDLGKVPAQTRVVHEQESADPGPQQVPDPNWGKDIGTSVQSEPASAPAATGAPKWKYLNEAVDALLDFGATLKMKPSEVSKFAQDVLKKSVNEATLPELEKVYAELEAKGRSK